MVHCGVDVTRKGFMIYCDRCGSGANSWRGMTRHVEEIHINGGINVVTGTLLKFQSKLHNFGYDCYRRRY